METTATVRTRLRPSQGGDTGSNPVGGATRKTWSKAQLHGVDVTKITTRTLDVLYAELAARGGACTHRPCPPAPCPEHGPDADARSASVQRVRTTAPA